MDGMHFISRRTACVSGAAAFAAGFAGQAQGAISAKKPDETRVVAIGGNYWHNGVVYERHYREVLGNDTGWRLFFAQSNQFLTPELIDTTDLLVLIKEEGPDAPGFSSEGLVETREEPAMFMTDEQEDAIVRNVSGRGMGLFCMHSSTRHPSRPKYHQLLGIEKPIAHGDFDNLTVSYINPDHPVTRGIPAYTIGRDQPRHVQMDESGVTVLVKATAERDGSEAIFGWCVERGNGRVVTFLPGHDPGPWNNPNHKKIMWRAAHWALKRDIPEKDFSFRFR